MNLIGIYLGTYMLGSLVGSFLFTNPHIVFVRRMVQIIIMTYLSVVLGINPFLALLLAILFKIGFFNVFAKGYVPIQIDPKERKMIYLSANVIILALDLLYATFLLGVHHV